MTLLELHNDTSVSLAKFSTDISETLVAFQDTEKDARPEFESKDLIFDNLKFHLHYDCIFFGLISNSSFGEDKAHRLLKDVRDEVNTMYKNNLSYILV